MEQLQRRHTIRKRIQTGGTKRRTRKNYGGAPASGIVDVPDVDVKMPKVAEELITELENISNVSVKNFINELTTDEDVKRAIILYYTIGLVVNDGNERDQLYNRIVANKKEVYDNITNELNGL